MSLLSNVLGQAPAKKPADDVLLLHSIFCIAAADGTIDDGEDEVIRAYANTLPEFRDMDGDEFQKAIDASIKISHQYNRDMKSSLVVLEGIESDAIRKKAYVLAVDIAMSSGDVDASEEQMLEEMQRILRIDDALATKIIEVVALKYAK